jgi:hypothetical protein
LADRISIVYSGRQAGYDDVVPALANPNAWGGRPVTLRDADRLDSWKELNELTEKSVLLLYGCLEQYLRHRFEFQSRPWVCAACFWFADLYALYRNEVPLGDTGIRTVYTNCRYYVEQTADYPIPVLFAWAPVPAGYSGEYDRTAIGSVVPNVEDRDFSLLLYVHKAMQDLGMQERLAVFAQKGRQQRLPEALEEIAIPFSPGEEMSCYAKIDKYLPCPRITDHRLRVVPRELFKAAQSGCRFLVMKSAVYPVYEQLLQGTISSLRQLRGYLSGDVAMQARPEMTTECCPTCVSFAEKVLVAQERSAANAGA